MVRWGFMTQFEKSLSEYIRDLQSEDPKICIQAATILGEWGNDRAVTPLINVLSSKDENLRRAAAGALKEIKNRRSIPPLLKVLRKDPSPEVRAEAAYALAFLTKFNFDILPLIEALADDHYLVRQNAAFALGKSRRRKAVRPLIDALLRDENYNTREMAAWALGEIHDKRAIAPLQEALTDPHLAVRKNAAYALGCLQAASAAPLLKKALLKPDETKDAAWALSKILNKKTAGNVLRDAFRKLKKENHIEACIAICRILYDVDHKIAESLKKSLLNDKAYASYWPELESLF